MLDHQLTQVNMDNDQQDSCICVCACISFGSLCIELVMTRPVSSMLTHCLLTSVCGVCFVFMYSFVCCSVKLNAVVCYCALNQKFSFWLNISCHMCTATFLALIYRQWTVCSGVILALMFLGSADCTGTFKCHLKMHFSYSVTIWHFINTVIIITILLLLLLLTF